MDNYSSRFGAHVSKPTPAVSPVNLSSSHGSALLLPCLFLPPTEPRVERGEDTSGAGADPQPEPIVALLPAPIRLIHAVSEFLGLPLYKKIGVVVAVVLRDLIAALVAFGFSGPCLRRAFQMSISVSLRFSPEAAIVKSHTSVNQSTHLKVRNHSNIQRIPLSSRFMRQDYLNLQLSSKENWPQIFCSHQYKTFACQSFTRSGGANVLPIVKSTSLALSRSYDAFRGCPLTLQLVIAVGFIAFSVWALHPLLRYGRSFFLHKDNNRKMSQTHSIFITYLQPLLLWTGIIFICRALDVVVLSTEASQAVKQRFLNFIRSLSTVLVFAYCLSSLIPQMQKLIQSNESSDAQKMGAQFASKAMYTAIWVAAFSLFMELLGFSTQKWLTAGGLGTVLLTLAGREIFTNFLSSLMIHATRPFVLNEWIQTKIGGYDVSGTVERVGWWSPTIIRGDDREAVHIPNHKFTVNIVRNLSQKTHWRVKTHFAISHFDAHKISNIVADMRKVLAKNPQVEQQKLHRRVFLDYIEPENQAFMILVSCFVKTSRVEEYLCVKEGILLDLLRVISHHKARLATPIRTFQKFYHNENMENATFADAINTARGPRVSRPMYLIEATSRMNEDKMRSRSEPYINEGGLRNLQTSDKGTTDTELKELHQDRADKEKVPNLVDSGDSLVESEMEEGKQQKVKSARTSNSSPESRPEGFDSMGQHNKGRTVPRSSHQKPASESAAERSEGGRTVLARAKQKKENERTRSGLEDNIVLGVALDGSKRTLPIHEDETESSPEESKMEK